MKLVFGLNADARTYPDFPGAGQGVVNASVAGPAGLAQALEVQLGLTEPSASQTVRIAAYVKKLREAIAERPSAFYAASFARDPWATARLLLGWRDELTLAGWRGESVGAPRLDDMALAEHAGGALARGMADRVRRLMDVLESRPKLELCALELIEPIDLLPHAWRAVIGALAQCGVTVRQLPAAPLAPDGDLGRLQAFLSGQAPQPLTGDGSLTLLEADTALMAAEAVAEWLVAGGEGALDGTVILCPDNDSALLDQAFRSRGLPALGQSASSPWRGALQILPLVFAIAWRPFNPKPLLDLLLLPRPPIGRFAAGRLANALSREPGLGGANWAKAWTAIEDNLAKRFEGAADAEEQVRKRLSRWRRWTEGGLFDRKEGMSQADARAIAARVSEWAIQADAGGGDPLLLKLASAASALMEAIGELGEAQLPGLLLDRMIAEAMGEGTRNPGHIAEAGALRSVQAAANVWRPARNIVWWGFVGPGPKIPPSPWDQSELARLKAAGCELDPPKLAAERLSWSYANAAHMATSRLIFVRPALSADQETVSHLLAHQLQPLFRKGGEAVRWRAEQLLEQPQSILAGRTLARRATHDLRPPQPQPTWALPEGLVARLAERQESPTTLEHLLDCQLRWLLRDVAYLSGGSVGDIPNPNQLIGNVAHEIANRVLQPGPFKDAKTVAAEAAALFEDVVTAIAAPLLQPEFAGDLTRARAQVPAALSQLAATLGRRGYAVVGTELARSSDLGDGLKIRGRIDLLVENDRGPAVVDLKWTRSPKHRREELIAGRSVQLSAYGAIADPDAGAPAPGAYYLLSQRRMLADAQSGLSDEPLEAKRGLPETWDAVRAGWSAWRKEAEAGRGFAMGLRPPMPAELNELGFGPGDEPCKYCEMTALCRVGALEI
ncbi:PD-(D/E)XK nuclease family protein [Phenylobacterium sp.]|uniref:PD-(D/E)XK nuclease family protein n=1 Tax=Phenylobacterium sp. TaxID=1871053 RepID=UPI0035AE038C